MAVGTVEAKVGGVVEATVEGIVESVGEHIVAGIEEPTEEVVADITGDIITATAMAFTEDMDMVGGVILTGGDTPTGGDILTTPITAPIMAPITTLITTKAMQDHRCFRQALFLRQIRDNTYLLIGTSVRTRRVTPPTLKSARVAGSRWYRLSQMRLRRPNWVTR
jgi:hypothetical protein